MKSSSLAPKVGVTTLFLLTSFLATFLTRHVVFAKEETSNLIFDLEEEEFKKFVSKNDPTMVMFYSPQCGHCHKMKPEFEKLPGALEKLGLKVHVAKIDGTENKKIMADEKIEGFPTLKLYYEENVYDYKGDRTSQAMSKWIKKMTGPAVIPIKNDTNLDVDTDEGYFIGYFQSEDTDLYKNYVEIASSNRLISSFFSVIPSANNQIIAIKEDEDKIEFDGTTFEEMQTFIKTEAFPKLAIISPSNFEKYLQRDLDFAWFEGTQLHYEQFEKSVREASKKFKNKISFVWINKDLYSQRTDNDGPSFFLTLLNGTRYELQDPVQNLSEPSSIIAFMNNAMEGKVDPFLKSENIPETNDEAVKIIVAKNFIENVFQPHKDVMIEIYAPWCGHCKQLEPVYKEVAEHFQSNPNVLIAKMDGTANESPSPKFDWRGFPTIFFIKAGSDTPINYTGQRNKQSIVEFISKHGSQASKPSVSAKDSQYSEEL